MTDRVTAPGLAEALARQGRRANWLARQAEVDASLLSHAMAGRKTLPTPIADRIATILSEPFEVLFQSSQREPVAA